MNKYLIEILKIQSSIILPGLGALMVASTRTGKVVFNPHLKFNDGSLAQFISDKEGVDKQEAENKVAKWVREIEAELGKGNTFEIYDLGQFYTTKDGAIDFKMDGDQKIITDKKADTKITTPEVKAAVVPETKKEEPKKESTLKKEKSKAEVKKEKGLKNTLLAKAEKIDVTKKVTKEIKKTADKGKENVAKVVDKTKEKIAVAKESVVDSKQEKNTFTPKVDEAKKDSKPKTVIAAGTASVSKIADKVDAKTVTVAAAIAAATGKADSKAKKGKPNEEKKEKKKKKKRRIWPWIILLLFIGGGAVAGFMYKNEIKSFLFAESHDDGKDVENHESGDDDLNGHEGAEGHDELEEEMNSEGALVDDTTAMENDDINNELAGATDGSEAAIAEEEITDEPEPEIIEEPVVQNTSSPGGSYHLIGNSFGERSNADNYQKSMSSKGYNAKVLGKFDNLYLVAIKSFDSRESAKNGMTSVSNDAPKAWVFKYAK